MRTWPELRRPLFIAAVLLYGTYQLNRRVLHVPVPALLSAYLADLVAMPVLLSLALATQRRLGPHPPSFVFPDAWLVAAWLFVSVWFEGVLPCFSPSAVADPLDIVAYAIGTLVFRRWLNRPT